jgi:hypothetical protein
MKVSDMDKQEEPLPLPAMPSTGTWLRVVGAAIALLLICFAWTVWAQGTRNRCVMTPFAAAC